MTWPVKLAFAGDIYPVKPLFREVQDPAFEDIVQLVRAADAAIGNFEIPLTIYSIPVEKLLNIKADPSLAADVAKLGFKILTLANNHSVDFGWIGLSDTLQALRSQGLTVVGVGATQAEAADPAIVELDGVRVGVLGVSCLLPTGMSAGPLRPGIASIHIETSYEIDAYYQMEEPGDPNVVKVRTRARDCDLHSIAEIVRAYRTQVDVMIVSIHWGFGSGEQLAGYQQPLGRALIDAGADIVHGHHPHAVHPIEFYRGKPILYGVGTFLGQQVFLPASPLVQEMWRQMSPDGLVIEAAIEHNGCISLTATPTTLDGERLPRRAQNADFKRIVESLQRLSLPFGTQITTAHDRITIAPQRT